jgi:hypothetical protein
MSDPPTTLTNIFPNADLKNLLQDHVSVNTLISKLVTFIKLIPNFTELKLEPELTKLLMNIVKDEINNKDTDQITILIQALTQTFNLNDKEIAVIKQQITFLKNNSYVKGIPLSKKCIKSCTRWLSRKIG